MMYNITITDELIDCLEEVSYVIEHEAEIIFPDRYGHKLQVFINRYSNILPDFVRVLRYKRQGGI